MIKPPEIQKVTFNDIREKVEKNPGSTGGVWALALGACGVLLAPFFLTGDGDIFSDKLAKFVPWILPIGVAGSFAASYFIGSNKETSSTTQNQYPTLQVSQKPHLKQELSTELHNPITPEMYASADMVKGVTLEGSTNSITCPTEVGVRKHNTRHI